MNNLNGKPELRYDCLECEATFTAATLPQQTREAFDNTDDDCADCPACLHGDLIAHRADWGLKKLYPVPAPGIRR